MTVSNLPLSCSYYLFSFNFQILASPVARQQHGYEAIMLLTLLVNYRKYEVRRVPCYGKSLKYSISDRQLRHKSVPGLGASFSRIVSQSPYVFIHENEAVSPRKTGNQNQGIFFVGPRYDALYKVIPKGAGATVAAGPAAPLPFAHGGSGGCFALFS